MSNIIKVAVIDDGVSNGVFNPDIIVDESYLIDDNNCIIVAPPLLNISHGSICAAIIKQYGAECSIISIKVLNDGKGEALKLKTAINYCINNRINIINLSLGTRHFNNFGIMKGIADAAKSAGVILVCACNNDMKYTVPAAFSSTISVIHDMKMHDTQISLFNDHYYNIDCIASGEYDLKVQNIKKYKSQRCNSYATAYITALITIFLSDKADVSKEEILQYIRSRNEYIDGYKPDYFKKNENLIIDVPIISIVNDKDHLLSKELKNLFLRDQYNVIILSANDNNDINCGNNIVSYKKIQKALCKYDNDLFILSGKVEKNYYTDICIEICRENYVNIIFDNGISKKIRETNYGAIYNYIKSELIKS